MTQDENVKKEAETSTDTPAEASVEAAKEMSASPKQLTVGKVVRLSAMIVAVAAVLFCAGFIGIQLFYKYNLDSYFTKADYKKSTYRLSEDLCDAAELIAEKSEEQIKALPKVYVIPTDQYVAPAPAQENYDKYYKNYEDETISVHYYSETHYDALFHFIEVKIAHPSQIRMALAKNTYSTNAKKWTQRIAKDVNAVAAIDGCYYNVRNNGILIYQGKSYRMKAVGWDVLLIDSDGDFHIVKDTEVVKGDILEKYDIVNSVTFGPALVLNGKAQKITNVHGYPNTLEPRAAIAQLGKLHYLLCTVDGRQEHSEGVTQAQLAQILAKKGCESAYNLDGGQSATLILGNRVKNSVAYGGQRILGDILYFATALETEEE